MGVPVGLAIAAGIIHDAMDGQVLTAQTTDLRTSHVRLEGRVDGLDGRLRGLEREVAELRGRMQ